MYATTMIISIFIISVSGKQGCPLIHDKPTSFEGFARGSINIFNNMFTPLYDTNKIKYFTLTPKSYPNLEDGGGKIDLKNKGCDGKPILFNCHGWIEQGDDPRFVEIFRAFVHEYDGCVVSSDYSDSSYNLIYMTSVRSTKPISSVLADRIMEDICSVTNCTQNLQMHGHSWGAHTCGIAGYILSTRGLKPARMIAGDAAGPYFDDAAKTSYDPREHLSIESAQIVINVKTSIPVGTHRTDLAHQTQYIGNCGSAQDQCLGVEQIYSGGCDHFTAIYIIKSTIRSDFPLVNLMKCKECPYVNSFSEPSEKDECTDITDYLGWQSRGTPGIFVIKELPVCLNLTVDRKYKLF